MANNQKCNRLSGEVFWWVVSVFMCHIFISHSELDSKFVGYLNAMCSLLDIECLVAEYKQQAGKELWDKIQSMIERSYIVIPILTANGVSSEWVKKEVTMAKTLNKKFIPVVQDFVKNDIPDELKGKEYVPYNAEDLTETLLKIALQLRELKRNDIGFATNC